MEAISFYSSSGRVAPWFPSVVRDAKRNHKKNMIFAWQYSSQLISPPPRCDFKIWKGYANMYAFKLIFPFALNLFQVLFYYILSLKRFWIFLPVSRSRNASSLLPLLHWLRLWTQKNSQEVESRWKMLKALENVCLLIDCLINLALCTHIKKIFSIFLPYWWRSEDGKNCKSVQHWAFYLLRKRIIKAGLVFSFKENEDH